MVISPLLQGSCSVPIVLENTNNTGKSSQSTWLTWEEPPGKAYVSPKHSP